MVRDKLWIKENLIIGKTVKVNSNKMIVMEGFHLYNSADLLLGEDSIKCFGLYLESPCGSWEVNIAHVLDRIELIEE